MNKQEPPAWGCLCFRPGGLEATTRFDPPSAECPNTLHLEGEPPVALEEWLKQVPEVQNLVVAVPTRDVLMMVTDFPSQHFAELGSMVELQAEEISPFPPERTGVAWEVLREAGSEISRVLMVLVPLQKLERLHDLLLPQTGLPVRLDVEVMGWLEMMQVNGHLSSGTDLWVLILAKSEATLVAWHDDTPVLFRSLGAPEELSAEAVREEVLQARVNVETSFPRSRMESIQIWHEGEAPGWAVEAPLSEHQTVHSLQEIAPATHGVLVRSQLGYLLDLTPKRWKEEASALKTRKKVLRIGGAVAAAWVLCIAAVLLWGWVQARQVKRLEAANQENADLVAEIRELSQQVRSLTQFTDRRRGALEALRLLAEAVPGVGTLRLEEFRYRKQGGHTFNGTVGGDVQPFNRFLDALTATESLQVEDYDLQQNRDGYRFRLEMDWNWEDLP